MPRSTLSKARVMSMLGGRPDPEALASILFASKAEVAWGEGDDLSVEVTADRLDLLSEGGLGLALQGALGEARGQLRPPPLALDPPATAVCDGSVDPLRPFLAAVVVRAPGADGVEAGLLGEAVRFQEVLHATVGMDRRLASLGLYPYDRLQPPFRYAMEPVGSVTFVPLDGRDPTAADAFLAQHPMAARYGALGASEGRLLTLRDARGTLMSVPPILNANPGGAVREGDRTILLESTGTRSARVGEAIGLLSLVFAARGWSIAPVEVRSVGGEASTESAARTRTLDLRSDRLGAVAGRPYPASEVEHLLASARLTAHPAPHGWSVEAPAWRPDLLQEIDVIEEVVLAKGVRAEDGTLPPSPTRGGRRAESRFHERVGRLLLGSGFSEMCTPVLVSEAWVNRLERLTAIRISNPVSDLYERVRDSLLLSLMGALENNLRSGYPQRFYEVGPVVQVDRASETGTRTSVHLGALMAEERAGFADAASMVDYLTGAVAGVGVREPAQLPGTVPGRAARVRLAGEVVAELGELVPSVLSEIRVPVPVAWFEVDLSSLWPLARPAAIT